jgi:hypothetical protein
MNRVRSKRSIGNLVNTINTLEAADNAEESARIAAINLVTTNLTAESDRAIAVEGSLASLSTETKVDLVSGINELHQDAIDEKGLKDAKISEMDQDLIDEAATRSSEDALKVAKAGDSMTGNLAMGSNNITGLSDGVQLNDAVNMYQLQSAKEGFDYKSPAKVATTENITLTGTTTIDGVVVVENDRVLVWKQDDAVTNGVYEVRNGPWVLASDFDGIPVAEVLGGAEIRAIEGNLYGGNKFYIMSPAGTTINVGVDEINFSHVPDLDDLIPGNAIRKVGNEISVNPRNGITTLADDEIGVDLSVDGGLFTTEDGSTESTEAAAQIAIKLDGITLTTTTAGTKITDSYTAARDAYAENYANANKLDIAQNLSDVESVTTSRTNLNVYSKEEVTEAVRLGGSGYGNFDSTISGDSIVFAEAPKSGTIFANSTIEVEYVDEGTTVFDPVPVIIDNTDVTGKTFTLQPTTPGEYDGKTGYATFAYVTAAV